RSGYRDFPDTRGIQNGGGSLGTPRRVDRLLRPALAGEIFEEVGRWHRIEQSLIPSQSRHPSTRCLVHSARPKASVVGSPRQQSPSRIPADNFGMCLTTKSQSSAQCKKASTSRSYLVGRWCTPGASPAW